MKCENKASESLECHFFTWLFSPLICHGLPWLQLGFWNNSVLWGRAVNPMPSTLRIKTILELILQGKCFVWLFHWGPPSFGDPGGSYTTAGTAPSFLETFNPSCLELHGPGSITDYIYQFQVPLVITCENHNQLHSETSQIWFLSL